MIKHLTILIVAFYVGLAASVVSALIGAVIGNLILLAGGFAVGFILFALLVVLLQERRVMRIVGSDHYRHIFNPTLRDSEFSDNRSF